MCYDVQALTKLKEIYAKKRVPRQGQLFEDVKQSLEEMDDFNPIYHTTGFDHPKLLVFTNEAPYQPQLFQWGLIPFWVKDQKQAQQISNKTLNARGETIFEKPAFRHAAKNKRCLVFIDAFYEHHQYGNQKIPFRVALKNGAPMILAGLWSKWNDEDGFTKNTFSIVTAKGNDLMAKIHNNPKIKGPRMPLILENDKIDIWLSPIRDKADQELVTGIINPIPESDLTYHPVGTLRGKSRIGNIKQVIEPKDYKLNFF